MLLLCWCAAYLLQELAFAAYVSLFKQQPLMVFSATSALSVSVSSHRSVSLTSVVCKRRCKFSLVSFFALRPFAGPQFQIGYKKATNTNFFMWLYFSCY